MEVPKKLKIELPYDSAMPLLCLYPKESQLTIVITVYPCLFIVTKLWSQPRCLSMNELIKKKKYIYTHISNGFLFIHKEE
jgi:hypothetical protein